MKQKLFLLIFSVSISISALCQQNNHLNHFERSNAFENNLADEALAPFYHGVASGDPLSNQVIIWTRVTPNSNDPVPVKWRVCSDKELKNVVSSGTFLTSIERDFTVKIDVTGLQASTTYYYGFQALGKNSLTGRTKTAPINTDHLRFAVVSCADYENGYYTAFRKIAQRADLDAVIHLGDYLYEYGEGSEERPHVPANEILTLSDYRIRHSHYKLDADLRAAHQQHPWITVWDDHESANNSYKDGAGNHTEGSEGNWNERKSMAIKAYGEWMPIRIPDEDNKFRIWRTIKYGNLVDLIMLDTRLYGRDQQLADAVQGGVINDENRTMLGTEQLQFAFNELKNSTAKWKVLGQQVMMMQWNIVGAPLLDAIPGVNELAESIVRDGGAAFNGDAWDGYPKERKKILDYINDNNINNVIVLTGDIHTSWAADLHPDPYSGAYIPLLGIGSRAVEFVTPSITSGNFDAVDPTGQSSPILNTAIKTLNPHIKYVDLFKHGYLILDLKNDQAQGDWFYLSEIATPNGTESFGTGYSVAADANRLGILARDEAPAKDNPSELAPETVPNDDFNVGISNKQRNAVILSLYPNPVNTSFKASLIVNENEETNYSIINTSGQVVKQLLKTNKKGLYELSIDASDLSNGIYFLTLDSKNEKSSFKFEVLK